MSRREGGNVGFKKEGSRGALMAITPRLKGSNSLAVSRHERVLDDAVKETIMTVGSHLS